MPSGILSANDLHSRWRDFLTSDGEKPDRHRDTEFELIGDTHDSLMQFWATGWQTLFDNIEPLTVDAVAKVIERERPDAMLPTLGGQTALNLAVALARAPAGGGPGVLDRYGVKLIGASLEVIETAGTSEKYFVLSVGDAVHEPLTSR